MNEEQQRLEDAAWKQWGSYVSDRQWGTVREDYSANGDAWNYTTHDKARSKAYRWGEEGIGGICDNKQLLCFAVSLWNGKDPIVKEILFGLSNGQGNHGEDVKELYYYLDATPTHSYMKMLYKYPQAAFPYQWLIEENHRRDRLQPEFELMDTGIFDKDEYFDVFIEYAKASPTDILIKVTVHNRSIEEANVHLLPTLWFRNTWVLGYDDSKPELKNNDNTSIGIHHKDLGDYTLYVQEKGELLFCDNETNNERLYNCANQSSFTKDGINNYIVEKNSNAINKESGTKVAAHFHLSIPAEGATTFQLRLSKESHSAPFSDFEEVFAARLREADSFYNDIQAGLNNEVCRVQRQAFAGMLWCKQFYYYDIVQWLDGDPAQPKPPEERHRGRNNNWRHLTNSDIISMPDKWEYPWYAAWDLAFHCVPFALIDSTFAKKQLMMLVHEWYMQPAGELPAYEWSFGDVNPPVHAWAAFRVYKMDEKRTGKGDVAFLEKIFHKLVVNFTWWVNRKDKDDSNIFEGGFLGLDNIGVFDRSKPLPGGAFLEQADGTSWMAMYALNMMRIALELAMYNPVYQDMATKFFEHFLYIAEAMASMIGDSADGLWDDEDEFFYDSLKLPDGSTKTLKVRSAVGLIPLFAVEVIDHDMLMKMPQFQKRLEWFLSNRPHLADLVSHWDAEGVTQKHLLSLLRGHRMKKILKRMLDETEFLSEYGVRALSKYHKEHPYIFSMDGEMARVDYTPGESTTDLFAGNSNWRGPIWMPLNYLIIESLQRFHYYYTDDFTVECPTGSGTYLSLLQIADLLSQRLANLFLPDTNGRRAVFGDYQKLQTDEHFKNYVLFYEYFHGDTGRGVGASHQTGWTGLIAKLLQPRR